MRKILFENKVAVWVVALLACIIFLVLATSIYLQRKIVIENHEKNLQVLANEKALIVSTYLEEQKDKLKIISSINVFRDAASYPKDEAKIKLASDRIKELKDIIPGITITDKNGIVIIGENDLPGTDYSGQKYYLQKERKITFERYYDPIRKNDYIAVVGPLYNRIDRDRENGAIVFDLKLDDVGLLMREKSKDKNNEVYLVDGTGMLLSNSKYVGLGNKNGVLIQDIKSEGAEDCLEDMERQIKDPSFLGHTEEVEYYKNYVGIDVMGTHDYVPEIGCIIAEEDIKNVSWPVLFGKLIEIFINKED